MAVSIDQQFIEYIVKSLVGHPDDVKVERRIDEKGVLLELSVNPEDLGRVIGKRGSTAQSIRTLLRALGTKNDARYNLKIVDTGSPEDRPSRRSDDQPRDDSAKQASDEPQDDTSQKNQDAADEPRSDADDVDMSGDDDLPDTASDDHSDIISRTRKELDDLDDLDV